jgi:hypothetical protein
MLSHCCASCGKTLDSSSRSYARALRMWIAKCPRCGFAVRWNPRGARAPLRLWARTRTLNVRFGIALSGGQAAGLIAFAIGAMAVDRRHEIAELESLSQIRRAELLAIYAMFAASAAVGAAVSAIAFAPHRSMAVRLLCAWLLGAAPVTIAVSLFALLAGGRSSLDEVVEALQLCGGRIALACAAVPLASALLAYALAPLQSRLTRFAARRFRRTQNFHTAGFQQA